MIKHLFFDLDNTLWDHRANAKLTLEQLYRFEEIWKRFEIRFDDFYSEYHTVNERLWTLIRDEAIDKEYLREHRFLDTFAALGVHNRELAQRFEIQFLDEILHYNELVQGAVPLLEYLKEKAYVLHILSNGFKEVTLRKCELSQISRFFETIVSADEVGVRKPHPSCFDYSLNRAGARKEESLFIGDDWVADIEGARAFGMEAIFFDVFKDGYSAPGVKCVEHLDEIHELL